MNPCYHLFGTHNERIITPPFLSDADGWGVLRPNDEIPIVEMAYLSGFREPRFILASDKDTQLEQDLFGLKLSHVYGGAITDYRSGYKSIGI